MVKRGFINKLATLAYVDRTTKSFDVRKAKRDPEAVSLSGGNLQKFVVGREILRDPGVLVVSQPTWGVDAGAAAVIRQALVDLAGRGSAVLVVSQDLDELTEIADRIAVMFHGRLSPPLEAVQATRERLGLLMGGADPAARDGEQEADDSVIRAPITGRIVKLFARRGDRVAKGDRIAAVEAMKLEHVLLASRDGGVAGGG